MSDASDGFTIRETHGMLLRSGVEISASSDKRKWSSLYASLQREIPFEATFTAVGDELIVLQLDGPVTVHRRIQKGEAVTALRRRLDIHERSACDFFDASVAQGLLRRGIAGDYSNSPTGS